jgi:hypothetical protein
VIIADDTGRALLNRALAADFPGTLAVRCTTFEAARCYDGDVLFENLELMRTVRAFGEKIQYARDVFVRRMPPDAEVFPGQRTRQAYDSRSRCGELLLLPSAAMAVARRSTFVLAATVLITVAVPEAGRRRRGALAVYPPGSALWAPLWLAERVSASQRTITILHLG